MSEWLTQNSTAIVAVIGIVTPVLSGLITLVINNRYKNLEIQRNKRNEIIVSFAEQYSEFTINPNQSQAFKLQATAILLMSFCRKKSTRYSLLDFSSVIVQNSKKTTETDEAFKRSMSLIADEKK